MSLGWLGGCFLEKWRESRDSVGFRFEDNEFTPVAVVVQDWRTGVERGWRTGLVFDERDESGGLGRFS